MKKSQYKRHKTVEWDDFIKRTWNRRFSLKKARQKMNRLIRRAYKQKGEKLDK